MWYVWLLAVFELVNRAFGVFYLPQIKALGEVECGFPEWITWLCTLSLLEIYACSYGLNDKLQASKDTNKETAHAKVQ
jgi:hypothetical protein